MILSVLSPLLTHTKCLIVVSQHVAHAGNEEAARNEEAGDDKEAASDRRNTPNTNGAAMVQQWCKKHGAVVNTREVSALLRELDKTMATKASLMTRLRKGRAALWRFLKKHKISIVGGGVLLLAVLALHSLCKKNTFFFTPVDEGGSGDNEGRMERSGSQSKRASNREGGVMVLPCRDAASTIINIHR